jgi:Predicted ATP-dependent protease
MSNYIKLSGEDLNLHFNNLPDFITTDDIEPFTNVIGQKRAIESIDLGLKMNKKEYNIYISGKSGTGKTGYIIRKIEEFAKNIYAPKDWCYVYNFESTNVPMAITLETGTATAFKEDLSEFIKYLFKEVQIIFNSKNYESEKNNIVDKFEKDIMSLTRDLNKKAKESNFSISQSPTGEFLFIPLIDDDKEMTSEDYDALSDDERDDIENKASGLRMFSNEVIKETKHLNKEMDEELKQLDDRIAENIIEAKINKFVDSYGKNENVVKYLQLLKKDIIENIYYFIEPEEEKTNEAENRKLFYRRYEVNILVANDPQKGAPVIFADSSQYGNIFGNIEYENKYGNLITDFTLIRPGYIHQANGGFLIIKAADILKNSLCWQALKRCINLETIIIDSMSSHADALPILTLKPENIPLKTKVIIIGSDILYSLLLENDLEFEKLFRIKAEFEYEIENDKENVEKLIGFISNYVKKNNFKPITRAGIIKLLKYCSRIAENKNFLSTSMSSLCKIVDFGDYFATSTNSSQIDELHIQKALDENEAMHGLVKKNILDLYKSKKYIVELNGSKIGQINGLSVVDYGDCTVGQQHRITVTTYAGRKGIINIEREANMSGSIHSKGIMILSGYVGELIGQETSISFNASIVFEQLYSGIEGDSASAAELLALLSSLSDVPFKQSLAITGSVNQKGEIQPIGGVNDKIEGYFDICSLQGLDGSHGVIIPFINIDDLVLHDRVIEAVNNDKFHIYAVHTIEQCFEILCDDIFRNTSGSNLMNLVKYKIIDKLKRYNLILGNSK